MNNKTNFDIPRMRVAAYIRVSTEEQKMHGISVEAQKTSIEEWAKQNNCKIVRFYNDAGFSARKSYSKRPAMTELLKDVQDGKVDLIVFTKLDRWFRSLSDYFKVQEILEKNNVNWRTIQEDYDTSNANGRFKINIMLSVAQDEADRTSERLKAVFDVKRQKREPLSGSCPIGYKQENKKFIKDPSKEKAVDAFFDTYLKSGSVSLAQKSAQQFGVRISYKTAFKMLGGTCYYGTYSDTEGMTPPYITKEQFDKIQAIRKHNVRKTERDRVYIFSGLIKCGECGLRYGSRINHGEGASLYSCSGYTQKTNGCNNRVHMSERKIESYLIAHVGRRLDDFRIEVESIRASQKERDYKGEISAAKKKIAKLKNLYLDDLITLEEYKSDFEMYIKEISKLELEESVNKAPDFSAVENALCTDWESMYQSSDRETKRAFWRTVLREIRIYNDRHIEFDLNVIF